jgi:hypothetical protein
MTDHVIHGLVRDYTERGSHDIDVVVAGYRPGRYQAVCLDCPRKSAVGTVSEADKALINHQDETVAARERRPEH